MQSKTARCKDGVWYDSIYIKCLARATFWGQKATWWRWWRDQGLTVNRYDGTFGGMRVSYSWISDMVAQLWQCTQIFELYTYNKAIWWYVNYISVKLFICLFIFTGTLWRKFALGQFHRLSLLSHLLVSFSVLGVSVNSIWSYSSLCILKIHSPSHGSLPFLIWFQISSLLHIFQIYFVKSLVAFLSLN